MTDLNVCPHCGSDKCFQQECITTAPPRGESLPQLAERFDVPPWLEAETGVQVLAEALQKEFGTFLQADRDTWVTAAEGISRRCFRTSGMLLAYLPDRHRFTKTSPDQDVSTSQPAGTTSAGGDDSGQEDQQD